MIAAEKTSDLKPAEDVGENTQMAQPVDLSLTTVPRESPFRSPARDMQQTLAHRLQQQSLHTRAEIGSGIIAGILGATLFTGIFIYATL